MANIHPYPGLRPFRSDEDHLFFGREEQTAELVTRLRESRFVSVVGTSGSGKSSLVRSGLIPALLRGRMRDAGSAWEVATMRPGGHPLQAMAEALLEADLYDPEDEDAALRLEATLGSSRHGLVEAVTQSDLDPEDQFLFVVDQFEELFRFGAESARHGEEAIDFVNVLLQASQQTDRGIYVVITMRSDFLGDCAQFPGLAEAVNQGEYLIPRMNRQQCRSAIEGPAKVAGAKMSSVLLQRLLNDLGEDQDQLPILQHALMRTWDAWLGDHEDGEAIDLRHYDATGGMKSALSRHADEVYENLADEAHREVAQRLFQALTERGSDNRETRRPGSLGRLEAIVGGEDKSEALRAVIDAYRQPGVTFLMPGEKHELNPATVIDVSHESLMRVWERLRGWVEAEAQSARIYQRLVETAILWRKDQAGLYHDPDLQIAQTWRETQNPNAAWAELYGGEFESAVGFLEQSHEAAAKAERVAEEARQRELEQAKHLAEEQRLRVEEQKRAAKRLRWLVAGSLFIAVVAIAAFFQAQRAEQVAEAAKDEAEGLRSEAEDAASELNRSLVLSDFDRASERWAEGKPKESLPFLARAARRDPAFWQSGFQALTTLAQNSFQTRLPTLLEHDNSQVQWYAFNALTNLVWTREYNGPEGYVWDAATGERLYPLADGKKADSVQFTPNGRFLLAVVDGTLQGWNARSGESLGYQIDLTGNVLREPLFGVGGSETGPGVMAVHYRDGLQLFDPETGAPRGNRLLANGVPPRIFAFAPDGNRVCAILFNGALAIWNAANGALQRVVDPALNLDQEPPGLWGTQEDQIFRGYYHYRGQGAQGVPMLFSQDSRFLLLSNRLRDRIAWLNLGDEEASPQKLSFEDQATIGIRWVTTESGSDLVACIQDWHPQNPDNRAGQGTKNRTLVYDLHSAELKVRIDPQQASDTYMGFPADETVAIMAYEVNDNEIVVYNLETGEEISRTGGQSEGVAEPFFGPHGRTLFAYLGEGRVVGEGIDRDSSIRTWDVFSGATLGTTTFQGLVVGRGHGPAGERWLARGVEFGNSRWLCDARESGIIATRSVPGNGNLGNSQWFRTAPRLLASFTEFGSRGSGEEVVSGQIAVMDMDASVAEMRPLPIEHEAIHFASYSDDGSRLLVVARPSADHNERVCEVWDPQTRKVLHRLAYPGSVNHATFDPSGQRVAISSNKGRLLLWNLESGEIERTFPHDESVHLAKFSPDGQRLLTATSWAVHLWDVASASEVIPSITTATANTYALPESGFSADGSTLFVATRDGKLRVVDAATGQIRHEHQIVPLDEQLPANDQIQPGAFSPGYARIAVAKTRSARVHVVEVNTGEVVREFDATEDGWTFDLAFSADGRSLLTTTGTSILEQKPNAHLWNLDTGSQEIASLDTGALVLTGALSPDERLIATGTYSVESQIQIWDRQTGKPLMDPIPTDSALADLAFRADGRQLMGRTMKTSGLVDGIHEVWLIDLPPSGEAVSDPLIELMDVVSGERFNDRGGHDAVPMENLGAIREKILNLPNADGQTEWAQWVLSDPQSRPIAPGSPHTRAQLMHRLLRIPTSDEDLQRAFLTDRPSKTVAALHDALKLDPNHAFALARMGYVLGDEETKRRKPPSHEPITEGPDVSHRWNSAQWYLRQARERAPEDPDVLAYNAAFQSIKAHHLSRSSDHEAARSTAQQAVSLDANGESANAHYMDALTAAQAGDWEHAASAFGRALDNLVQSTKDPEAPDHTPPLEILEDLQAEETWAGKRELTLPQPIAGTFEDFESVAEGALPNGWQAETLTNRGDPPILLDLNDLGSDSFQHWTVISRERFQAADANDDHLAVQANQFVNGTPVQRLLQGHYLHAESAARSGGQMQSVVTPDYNCTEASGVHLVFHSAHAQNQNSVAAIEISTDGGQSWSPVTIRLDAVDILYDSDRQVDAVATLTSTQTQAPPFKDAEGKQSGRTYGAALKSPIDASVAAFIQAGEDDHRKQFKRVEWFRLPQADGQPTVRLRFTHAGSAAYHWGIDNLGLYAIAPERVDEAFRASPGSLEPTAFSPANQPDRLLDLAQSLLANEKEPNQRERLQARLLSQAAVAHWPEDPRANDLHTQALAWTGDLTEAMTLNERCFGWRRNLPSFWTTRAVIFERRGEAFLAEGQTSEAAFCFEVADGLLRSLPGDPDENVLARLQKHLEDSGRVRSPETLIGRGKAWSYLDDGTDQGEAWRAIDFQDHFWATGVARLGYGDDARTTISFGDDPEQKHITTYFRHTFHLEDPTGWGRLIIRLQRDDGAIVYLNGEEVARSNMPEGEVDFKTHASDSVNNQAESRFFEFTASAIHLRAGRNVVAVEVHQQGPTSSDLGFDLELAAEGLDIRKIPSAEDLLAHEEALGLSPAERATMWLHRARLFADGGDTTRSEECLAQVTALDPDHPGVAYARAVASAEAGDLETAETHHAEAMRLSAPMRSDGFDERRLGMPSGLAALTQLADTTPLVLLRAGSRSSVFKPWEAALLVREAQKQTIDDPNTKRVLISALQFLGEHEEALTLLEELEAALPEDWDQTLTSFAEHRWIYRELQRTFNGLGRNADRLQARQRHRYPPRAAGTDPKQLDLSAHHNGSLFDGRHWTNSENHNLSGLSDPWEPRKGVAFDTRGVIQLNSGPLPQQQDRAFNALHNHSMPDEVTGIAVGQTTPALHVLISCQHGEAKVGTVVARLVMHYADGDTAEMPIALGPDGVADWVWPNQAVRISDETIGWEGTNAQNSAIRLSELVWQNPHPEKTIATIDFVSTKEAAAPFIVGITLE